MFNVKSLRNCVSIFALCLCAQVAVQAAELPVKDFAKHPPLNEPALSPDGKHLAVVVHNDDGSYQLAVLELPGLKPVSRLNMAPHDLPIDLTWVDDTRLAMGLAQETGSLNAPGGTGEVIAVDFDGSHKRVLYSWKLRGGAVNRNIMAMPRGGGGIAGVPNQLNGHVFIQVNPFSEGNGMLYSSENGRSLIFDVDSRSGHVEQMGEIDRGGMSFVLHDGVARYAIGGDDNDSMAVIVYMRDGKDDAWRKMPGSIGKRFIPVHISKDGKHVYAMYSAHGGPTTMVIANLDGSDRKVLASDPFASVAGAMWTPYPFKPYAVIFATEKPRVQYLGNGIYAQIHKALAANFPDEFITVAGQSHDGSKLIVHARSDRDPGSYALFDRASMHLSPLFQVMPWIDPSKMATRQPIRFKAHDGLELAGFLTLPTGGPGKDLPMVLIPHGGPIGPADSWAYDPWAQFLANRGYAVLQVNYRGSGGRGAKFQHAGYKQFGTGIMQDLIDGVHWAIDQGYADKDRVCVFGASFGGYSALMAPIRAPDMFKCSVDYAGVSDYMIEFNRSDTRRHKGGRTYFAQAIGTDEATVRAISPIYHLDRFNIPVLIIHGKDDPRVPYKNATELRSALEAAGKPYEWLVRDKEQHGFYSEENNEAMYQALETFLAKYIGPGKH